MKFETFTLPNGLRTVFVDTEAFPTLTTLVLVGAGSRYENEKNNGVAHFFEHMAFKGSKKYPNSFLVSSTIEGLGGYFNAFTSKDHTGYWIKAPNKHFETTVDVLSDMILHPLLLEEEIQREKGVIVEELNMYEDTPSQKASVLFESLLYKGTPLGFDIGGTKQTVVNFKRKTFLDYMKRLYHPKNTMLIVAGGLGKIRNSKLEIQKYQQIVKERFGEWKNGEKTTFVKVKDKQEKPQVLLQYKKTEQTHFCLGFRAYSFSDEKKYATGILATILGGGMSSRLFIEVRERRGLCYYISSGREMYHDVGNFVTRAGVTNNLDKTKQAIEITLKEHKKIVQGDVKNEELEHAKEILKGRLLLSLEDSQNVANFLGTKYLLEEKIETIQELIGKFEKVTLGDVVDVATEMFKPEKLNLALIGPFRKQQEFEQILTI